MGSLIILQSKVNFKESIPLEGFKAPLPTTTYFGAVSGVFLYVS